jgi:hypothetical protein
MAIIIETCPKCGHDLINEMICTYPPIPRKSCPSCGWSWEGEQEEIIRQPFGGNSFYPDDKYTLTGSKYDELVSADDACCAINNMNECVFTATQDWLKNNVISYEKIVEAVERTKKYKDLKQGF